jgi:hypothetical protein
MRVRRPGLAEMATRRVFLDRSVDFGRRSRVTAAMTWKVLGHDPIDKLDDDLWRVSGKLPRGPMPRTMTLLRLPDRRIVVHSAITLGDDAMREVEAWGRIAIVIVPNDHHRLDPAAYKARYPDVTIVCPAGARAKIEEKVKVDATEVDLGDTARYRILDGTHEGEGWLEIKGGTLVMGDLIMNVRPLKGFGGWIMGRMGFTGDAPKVVPATKKALVADRELVRKQIETLAATPGLRRVIVAHGDPITDAPADKLRAVAAAL